MANHVENIWAIMIRKILEQRRSACVLRFVHYAEIQPWSLLDCTCGKIWWNLDDIQRPVVLKFAISAPSDWPHPTTIFQS